MSSPTFTQFNTGTHPQHAHRHSSTSSTASASSTASGGPVLSSALRRDSLATSPTAPRPRCVSEADPFAMQIDSNYNPFISGAKPIPRRNSDPIEPAPSTPPPDMKMDRRMSREWDASKVPPSKFQRPEGSIWATPASRDGHIARNKIKVAMDKIKRKTSK